ncbi:MAG: hypothetical protein J7L94_03655 [Caldisericaceae bacterium]|nr:hypothetical protein [Caldisericaceae bacterium]
MERLICFIHIEKAAGITLHHIFKNNTFRYITLTPWSIWANDQENVFTAEEARIFLNCSLILRDLAGTPRVFIWITNRPLESPLSTLPFCANRSVALFRSIFTTNRS